MQRSFAVIPAIFMLDMIFKNKAEKYLSDGADHPLIKDRISLKLMHNTGAALSSFEGHPSRVRRASLISFAAVSALYVYACMRGKGPLPEYALAMILGGASSNCFERCVKGSVTDYLRFPLFGERTGAAAYLNGIVYNVSDLFIIAGGVLFVLSADDILKGA